MVEHDAFEAANGAVHSTVVPSRNETAPDGLPEPGGCAATDALSVTGCPKTALVGAATSEVVVAGWRTTMDKRVEELLRYPPAPANEAATWWVPTARLLETQVVLAAVGRLNEHSSVAPSKIDKVPIGLPPPGATTETEPAMFTAVPTGTSVVRLDTAVLVDAGPTVSDTGSLLADV